MKRSALFAFVAMVAAVTFAEPYTRLFKVANPMGDCVVRRPGAESSEPAQRNKAYPFGTTIVCGKDSSAVVLFSENDAVRLLADSVATVTIEDGETGVRVVSVKRGTALTRVGVNTAKDFFVVDTPVGRVSALSGNCRISLAAIPATKSEPAACEVELRAEPASSMKVVGPQFIVPILKNGYGAKILSRADGSYTCVTDLLGDYSVYVNTGLVADPPEPYDENAELNRIKLSTKAGLHLWREKAPVGGTTVVSVLATTSAGKGRESFAFAVGKSDIAARSNEFIDTITNELAMAEIAKAAADGGEAPSDDGLDGFGDFGDLGGDDGDGAAGTSSDASGDDSLFDFL